MEDIESGIGEGGEGAEGIQAGGGVDSGRELGGQVAEVVEKKLASVVFHRLKREKRWAEAEPIKNDLLAEAKKLKLSKGDAQNWAYSELDQRFPPLPPPPEPEPEPEPEIVAAEEPEPEPESAEIVEDDAIGDGSQVDAGAVVTTNNPSNSADSPRVRVRGGETIVTGIREIPESWPALPPNSSLAEEIQWVQANRLQIVEECDGVATVDLSRAISPPPSHAAIGWLETSIKAYSKYCEITARATQSIEDGRSETRRERMKIEEVRGLLAQMLDDGPTDQSE